MGTLGSWGIQGSGLPLSSALAAAGSPQHAQVGLAVLGGERRGREERIPPAPCRGDASDSTAQSF